MTQKNIILEYLKKNKSITSWEAIQNFHITRVADVILRLRADGHNIETERINGKNSRTLKKVQYARYVYKNPITAGENYSLLLA
tara:strand:- start:9476 stop:9727 length:252 start_codon:yes stop_codon:yes gene_type:complete